MTWTGEYTYTRYAGVEVLTPSDRVAIADYPVQEVVTRTVANPQGLNGLDDDAVRIAGKGDQVTSVRGKN